MMRDVVNSPIVGFVVGRPSDVSEELGRDIGEGASNDDVVDDDVRSEVVVGVDDVCEDVVGVDVVVETSFRVSRAYRNVLSRSSVQSR